ncbi:hypothetical protein [Streptomyces gardneri]|uniref:hypothetical protein n=1 Tax=Streptomyces gardneri TaxID=66892 RepID=UPI003F4D5261
MRLPLPHGNRPTGGGFMNNFPSGGALATPVEITTTTVQLGDAIQIGGRLHRVADLVQLPRGAKRLRFESGELLTMHAHTRLIAVRVLRRW